VALAARGMTQTNGAAKVLPGSWDGRKSPVLA
jgi:hypothetical protein